MPTCTDQIVGLGRVGRRLVQAAFDGGDIVSDGGSLLLRQVDDRIGLTRMAAAAFEDGRRKASVKHDMRSLLRAGPVRPHCQRRTTQGAPEAHVRVDETMRLRRGWQ